MYWGPFGPLSIHWVGGSDLFSYMYRKRKSGFTLLELIVVMAVVAILVAMGVPRFIGYQKDAKVTAMKADCKVLEDACSIYYTEEGSWPVNGSGTMVSGVITYGSAGSGTNVTAKPISNDKVKEHYRSLKNDVADYCLIDSGSYEGTVIYIGNDGEGLGDRSGEFWYGVNLVKKVGSGD